MEESSPLRLRLGDDLLLSSLRTGSKDSGHSTVLRKETRGGNGGQMREGTHGTGLGWFVRVGCCGGSGWTPGTTWCCGSYATREIWFSVVPLLGSVLAANEESRKVRAPCPRKGAFLGPQSQAIPATRSSSQRLAAPGQSKRQVHVAPPPEKTHSAPRRSCRCPPRGGL